jgi:hypothetical protein
MFFLSHLTMNIHSLLCVINWSDCFRAQVTYKYSLLGTIIQFNLQLTRRCWHWVVVKSVCCVCDSLWNRKYMVGLKLLWMWYCVIRRVVPTFWRNVVPWPWRWRHHPSKNWEVLGQWHKHIPGDPDLVRSPSCTASWWLFWRQAVCILYTCLESYSNWLYCMTVCFKDITCTHCRV